ncbi:potassium channel family protein [Thermococcus gammatolerans]|uniref:Potassium transport regulation protein, PhoU/TrkA-C related n=1 Tax=Thermococcus gammatolerans (strain DSM 15229 / JCM 11827 / EJ3) TaxID=593117 RepID=C5A4S6_THEGJ|nr:potassium channel family protein [Thermococcus gammatolerans]ACS33238.1 Potassium transport regulation protein, PhoU/TrkA-C related [Thermococcus gammatolerans EJ3]
MSELDEIRNCLVEMKDLSALMVDLAFSSVLYNSEDIAEEVYLLEEKMDDLTLKVKKLALRAAKSEEDPESLLSIIDLADINERISDAAYAIADIILRDIEPHPIIRRIMEDTEEELGRVTVRPGSVLIGKTLQQLKLPSKIGTRILAIKRGTRYIYNPGKDDVIQEGDVLIAVSPDLDKLRKLAGEEVAEEE